MSKISIDKAQDPKSEKSYKQNIFLPNELKVALVDKKPLQDEVLCEKEAV